MNSQEKVILEFKSILCCCHHYGIGSNLPPPAPPKVPPSGPSVKWQADRHHWIRAAISMLSLIALLVDEQKIFSFPVSEHQSIFCQLQGIGCLKVWRPITFHQQLMSFTFPVENPTVSSDKLPNPTPTLSFWRVSDKNPPWCPAGICYWPSLLQYLL